MLTKLSTKIFFIVSFIFGIFFLTNSVVYAQVVGSQVVTSDTNTLKPDTSNTNIYTSTGIDTTSIQVQEKISGSSVILNSKVYHECLDSLIMDWPAKKAYLYNKAKIVYEDITLEAAYIEIDFDDNSVFAKGLLDSAGKVFGEPIFKEGTDEYKTKSIKYNFKTKKGLVYSVTRQEGDAYVFIEEGKKMPDNTTYVHDGFFTTCSLEHPHFSIKYKKGKIIPKDKIVTGPIHMEIEDIPLPLILPFGFFPNKQGRANGILIPSYGHSPDKGYYLSNGGYYWGIGQHIDLALRGDIYSKGSFVAKAASNYNFRYKYSGNLQVEYAHLKDGEPDVEGQYSISKTQRIRWTHRQDPKASSNSDFSASVDFGSSSHDKLHSYNTNAILQNTMSSSISYRLRIKEKYNLSVNLNHSQNTQKKNVDLVIPQVSFSTPTFSPFARKVQVGPKKWYEKLNMNYNMASNNDLSTYDSLLSKIKFQDFNNGISHNLPMSITLPVGHFNWTSSISNSGWTYFKKISKYYDPNLIIGSDTGNVDIDTINGFYNAFQSSISTSISTMIYGMYMVKKGPITAVRHVITPALSFSYRPDYGSKNLGFWNSYTDAYGRDIRYSVFEQGNKGGPSDGNSGLVSLNIGNTLEMKVKSEKDTITGLKKVKLLESFSVGTSYDLAKDSFQLAPLRVSARTTIFKKMALQYDGGWDFYGIDSNGVRVKEFSYKVNGKLLRKTSYSWRLSMSYGISSNELKNKGEKTKYDSKFGTTEELNEVNTYSDKYIDFNNPWSVNVNYNFSKYGNYISYYKGLDTNFTHTIGLNGDINITSKWKVGFSTNYDILSNSLALTTIDVYRDLHCWELIFNWIPVGTYKSYNLTIRVKSAMLQDLKITKKRNYWD